MDVIAKGLHSAGKTVGVMSEVAVSIAFFCHPVVIKIQVDVARIPHTGTHHHIGDFLNLLFIDVLVEHVPAVPTHRRRFHQVVNGLRLHRNGGKRCQCQHRPPCIPNSKHTLHPFRAYTPIRSP